MRYSTLYKTPIKIVTIFLLLSSLHPGNYLHGQKQPDTLSFYLPNILVTTIESKTPGTVSLLPASTLEHTQPITIADLTQLLPGGLTNNSGVTDAQYFSVREVSLKNGVNQFHKDAAMGAQIWIDGSPLHFNAGINEPYEGYDARFLSLNQVKEAEIIRGMPSARYGNLTNSVLLLKTHQGRMPLSTSIRYNPKLKQYMLGKGFCISPQGHTLNLLADYTSQGDFHTGGIRLANLYHWLPAGKKLELSLTYTSRIGKEKQFVNEQNHTQRQRLDQRFSIQGEWQPDRRWLKKLSLRIDGSLQKSKQTKSQVNNASSQLYTDQKESGEWEAHVLSSNYMYTLVNESRPFYVETEMLASTLFPLRQGREISLVAGFSYRSEGNEGRGKDFDRQRPPSTSIRPRSFREIPSLHTFGGFIEATYRTPNLHVEAGLRNQGLKSRDYALIYQTEPRLNLLWSLFSSPSGYTLSLKGGLGWISFMPTLDKLYPEAIYNDKVSFYYNDSNESGNTLGILTTHAPGMERNMKLKTTVNRKIEVGLIGKTPAIRLDMTAFFEKQTDGFSSSAQYIPFSYREYDYLSTAQLRPEYKDGQVWVNGKAVPYQEKYSYTPVSVPVNTLHRKKHGIEMVADLGTFSPLRTSLIVDGIWLYVREKNTALNGIWPIQYTDKTEYPYVGFYDRQGGPGNESRSEIISTNFRFITRIPRIGLVTTLTWQMIWLYKYRTLYNGSTGENVWPLYWCGTDGIIHPFTEAQKEDPAFAPLLSTTAPERFLPNSYKPYGMLNIRVNKAFGEHITLAFFANNLADLRPTRYSASTRSYLQQNTQPFFGLELQIKL